MSVNFGSTNSSRYYSVPDNADFTLPDGDWTWVCVVKPHQATADPKYIVSTNTFNTANSFNLLRASSTNVALVAYNTNANLVTGSAIPTNAWSVVYASRRSNLLYVGWKPQGGGTGDESSGQAISGTSDGTALILAGRTDLNAARMWEGSVSWVALLKGKGLTATEVNDLAAGTTVLMNAPYAAQVSNLWWLQSSTPSTVTDSVNSRIATKQGTGYSADDTDPLPPIAALINASPCDQTDISGTGAITSSKDLTAANCTQTDTAATVQISQTHELTVAGSVQTDASGTGAIEVGGISLTASSCEQTDASSAGSLMQAHALTSAESTETDASSSGALTQIHALSVANSTQADVSSTGAITSSGDLAAANCLQTDTSTAGTITQTHSITAENSTQTDISGTGAIDVGSVINLMAANSAQTDSCQTAIITQTHLLIIAPSVQDDVAATSSIVQQHILAGANSIQWDACSTDNLIGNKVILPTSSRITGGMFRGEINSHGL